jgi:CheY-specific phosphatase CheX
LNSDSERIERWLDALTESIEELAEMNLGMEVGEAVKLEEPAHDVQSRASIELKSDGGCWLVSIAADANGCQRLARALLGMEEGEEDLSTRDVEDAFGEVLNILAGGLKKRLSASEGKIDLGLPTVNIEKPRASGFDGRVLASTTIGPIRTDLMIEKVGS